MNNTDMKEKAPTAQAKKDPAVAMGCEMYKNLNMSSDAVMHLLPKVTDERIKSAMSASLCFYEKTAGKVKEDAGTATLTVSRTASDGRVRVKYATIAGTAQPGVDYVAQSGILEWTDGDKKDKTIVLKIIPDLIAKYEGGDKKFSVRLEPMAEDELEDDEYRAAFTVDKSTKATLDTATVTLTDEGPLPESQAFYVIDVSVP